MSTTNTIMSIIVFVILCTLTPIFIAKSIPKEALSLKIVHINDIHSHFEETDAYSARCRPNDLAANRCFGGASRLYTKVHELRAKAIEEDTPFLILNAGDYYSGTVWYSVLKYKVVADMANLLNYTAMSLGNHEFDYGVEALEPFLSRANFDIVAANLVESGEPHISKYYNKSKVIDINGLKVGIVGYVTPTTVAEDDPGPTMTFFDELESVSMEARHLKANGVNTIIALGHSGYTMDKRLAMEIPELDLVVGGHSHTFLYSGGPAPSTEVIKGPYPTYITQSNGKVVPVVQAYCNSKYLGHLKMNLGSNGTLLEPVDGRGVSLAEVILLDHRVAKDPWVEKKMDVYRANLTEYNKVFGYTTVDLTLGGWRNLPKENNIGDVVTDSMAAAANADAAFLHTKAIRGDIRKGDINGVDVFNVLPFGSGITPVQMRGRDLRNFLEDHVHDLCANQTCNQERFMQVSSGLRVEYLIRDDNLGQRVQSARLRCNPSKSLSQSREFRTCEQKVKDSSDITFCEIKDEDNMLVALTDFYTKDPNYIKAYNLQDAGKAVASDYEGMRDYIQKNSPITQEVEGRISIRFEVDEH